MQIEHTGESEYCCCSCHDPDSLTVHLGGCCELCPICRRGIRFKFVERHRQKHAEAAVAEPRPCVSS